VAGRILLGDDPGCGVVMLPPGCWSLHFGWIAFYKQCWSYIYSVLTCTGARCWWRTWLRHSATSRKVAGSILDGVTGIFHGRNPSGRTMALGLTQPLTEMSTRNISWGVKAAGA